jgi:hypothetical protein
MDNDCGSMKNAHGDTEHRATTPIRDHGHETVVLCGQLYHAAANTPPSPCQRRKGHAGVCGLGNLPRDHGNEPTVLFASGATATLCPEYSRVPRVAIDSLANRYSLGHVKHKEKAFSALNSPEDYAKRLADREWIVARVNHVIKHALLWLEDYRLGRVPTDDNAGAVLWGGSLMAAVDEHNATEGVVKLDLDYDLDAVERSEPLPTVTPLCVCGCLRADHAEPLDGPNVAGWGRCGDWIKCGCEQYRSALDAVHPMAKCDKGLVTECVRPLEHYPPNRPSQDLALKWYMERRNAIPHCVVAECTHPLGHEGKHSVPPRDCGSVACKLANEHYGTCVDWEGVPLLDQSRRSPS